MSNLVQKEEKEEEKDTKVLNEYQIKSSLKEIMNNSPQIKLETYQNQIFSKHLSKGLTNLKNVKEFKCFFININCQ